MVHRRDIIMIIIKVIDQTSSGGMATERLPDSIGGDLLLMERVMLTVDGWRAGWQIVRFTCV